MKIIIAVVACVLLLNGCMSINPKSVRSVKNELLKSNPDITIESGFSFGVGALTIDLVDFAFVHDESLDLSKISKADIGVYQIKLNTDIGKVEIPRASLGMKKCSQEQVVIRVREPQEKVQVSACIKNEKVTGLTVFVLEKSELVVVNARGDFEALLSKLVKSSKQRGDSSEEAVIAAL